MGDDKEEIAEYSSKSDFSKAKQVYDAIQKCIEARAKEMKKGYYNVKRNIDGSEIRTWIPDSRQVYVGCVTALRIILSSEIKQHESYKKVIDGIIESIDSSFKEFAYEEKVWQTTTGVSGWHPTGRKFIPELESFVIIIQNTDYRGPGTDLGTAKRTPGGWDQQTNLYWDDVLYNYDLMFEQLNQLVNKINYFKQPSGY